jgi:REP element-mobilizing transposase RayT
MSTFLSLHYHFVFSTKNREGVIAPAWRGRLHDYIGGTMRNLGGVSEGVGGVADHVHVLARLRATHCVADFMRDVKAGASAWVHDEIGARGFAWQDGYAAFTVSATAVVSVQRYIAGQEEHHRTRTFNEELAEFLAKAGVEYNPKFLL